MLELSELLDELLESLDELELLDVLWLVVLCSELELNEPDEALEVENTR